MGVPTCRGKHEAVVLPEPGELLSFLELAFSVGCEGLQAVAVSFTLRRLLALFGPEAELRPLWCWSMSGAPRAFGLQVDVLPSESEQLALPKARGDGQHVEGLQPVPLGSLD